MNKNIKNILNEKLNRLNLNRVEISKNINKSISQNNNINNNIKIYAGFVLNKQTSKHKFLSKQNKICLISGKRKSIPTGYTLSRYMLKNIILRNQHTNIKKYDW